MKKTFQSVNRIQRLAKAAHPLNITGRLTTTVHDRLPAAILAITPVDIRMAVDANPERGERVVVNIPCPSGDGEVTVGGVVHWKEMRGSEHEVGIYLNQELPGRLQGLHTDTRRQSERYRCRISGRLNWGENRPESDATVVNYSHNGMAVQCPVQGVIDEVFTFRWRDSGVARSVKGVALWQIEQNGGYLVGCQLENNGGFRIAGISKLSATVDQ